LTADVVVGLDLEAFSHLKVAAGAQDGTAGHAGQRIQLATYEKAIQTAFQEVSDALAVRDSLTERLTAQRAQVQAYADTLRLTQRQRELGAASAVDVLTAQRSLYSAQQSLISLQLTEQANRLTLFKVLGGA